MPPKEHYTRFVEQGLCVRGCGRTAAKGSKRCNTCWLGDTERDSKRLDAIEKRCGHRGFLPEWQIRQIEEGRALARATHRQFAGEATNV